ncbi:uncharacterized protein LY89DRAFT_732647 [Mollisia scopiformis]|uniref:Uncharacterized protein n=1 Tax=Mollisia scopiformis TaxID=149040 RepID=A0A194XCP9_MOLSC|nr:uncharacterized protein LY89DRAFT_732647 [Mollisia scopiformis]KUJ17945.1 hypothetical protein LY89DRAFT_732647 [Mollisia scopiformis]
MLNGIYSPELSLNCDPDAVQLTDYAIQGNAKAIRMQRVSPGMVRIVNVKGRRPNHRLQAKFHMQQIPIAQHDRPRRFDGEARVDRVSPNMIGTVSTQHPICEQNTTPPPAAPEVPLPKEAPLILDVFPLFDCPAHSEETIKAFLSSPAHSKFSSTFLRIDEFHDGSRLAIHDATNESLLDFDPGDKEQGELGWIERPMDERIFDLKEMVGGWRRGDAIVVNGILGTVYFFRWKEDVDFIEERLGREGVEVRDFACKGRDEGNGGEGETDGPGSDKIPFDGTEMSRHVVM